MDDRKERKFGAGGGGEREGRRKAYRPARRTRSLPAKKYGGPERQVVGDFPYPLKYGRTGKGKWRREPRLPSDPASAENTKNR